jgi:sugar lactone lactonase YvrE
MIRRSERHSASRPPTVAEGWHLERITPVSGLSGANGLRAGPDGRIYVAECVGSQISALDVRSGELETISALGGDIVGPDDLTFDERGNLFVTEFMDARVSIRGVDGRNSVLRDDVPGANGITFHQGRLFIDECRIGGRLLELDLDGGPSRVILQDLHLPNALAAGPDGYLYFPLVAAGEIWRVHPDRGRPERVVDGLHHPVAVKFDSSGLIVSPQSETGEVLRISPQTGERQVLCTLAPCLDNLTFLGERLFVSHLTDGTITEILSEGRSREVLSGGMQFPLDLAIDDDGTLYISDNCALYARSAAGGLTCLGRMFAPGFPGSVRGLCSVEGRAFAVTTNDGRLVLYRPEANTHELLASVLDEPYGVALAPNGALVVAERGAGRVVSIASGETHLLAGGLHEPMGVVIAWDGSCYATESGAGRVIKINGSGVETVLAGLQRPQGLTLSGSTLYIVDAGAHALVALNVHSGGHRVIAVDLPLGAPPGVVPKPLRGSPPFSGPFGPFAGIVAARDGALYFSADMEGTVMSLRPGKRRSANPDPQPC